MELQRDPATRPFRFGVYMSNVTSRKDLIAKCQRAEDLGYDVIGVADHLDMWAPFPAVMLAAEVTERPKVATTVLNAAFYNPSLLARDVMAAHRLTDERLELGLGTGYMRSEFDACGLAWPAAPQRVDHLERSIAEIRRRFAGPNGIPRPPLWVTGRGDRVLRIAAREAEIIGLTGFAPGNDGHKGDLANADGLAERVAYVRAHLGKRSSRVELNVLVWRVMVTTNRIAAASNLGPARSLTPDELLNVPTVLIGTPMQIGEQLVEFRERFGFSYITVRDYFLDEFAPVIAYLR
ncbi:TIGR03621 family F420-dependent LLM class oxidoreductase [Jiangella asiatica]|uniref:TIGR03621 family F420-dependent LLM class oxidoreductase n=1 Tax=Jiangella asiatica TaxID=2530372 RepID=A0A4R5DFP8_9ACTN|nr:TIGR03621 family F420-dependent LLM class oxidoreductase [Jiangella asiatica]TDE10604.1 TIGR03621 family F420-dependent LLM class oxidoreductase [Jiangella asiatica]